MTHATSYARLTKRQARTVLTAMVLMSVAAVAVTLSPLGSTNLIKDDSRAPNSDVFLYRAEVDRIQDGEGYYQAVATELTTRGYPTKSVFNWRMPLPVWAVGQTADARLRQGFFGLVGVGFVDDGLRSHGARRRSGCRRRPGSFCRRFKERGRCGDRSLARCC